MCLSVGNEQVTSSQESVGESPSGAMYFNSVALPCRYPHEGYKRLGLGRAKMRTATGIHRDQQELAACLKKVENFALSTRNKEIILDFYHSVLSEETLEKDIDKFIRDAIKEIQKKSLNPNYPKVPLPVHK